MTPPALPPSAAPAPAGVARDVACAACGYNLRGLDPAGRCPECGAAVADALARGPFAGADRRWLRRVAAGVMLFNAIHAYFLVQSVLMLTFRGFYVVPAVAITSLVGATGAYLLSTSEPAAARGRLTLVALRLTAVAWALFTAGATAASLSESVPHVPYGMLAPLSVALPLLTLVLGLNAIHAQIRRTGDARLGVQIRVAGVGYVVLFGATHPFIVYAFDWQELVPPPLYTVVYGSIVSGFALCAVWVAFLSGRLRQAMSPGPGRRDP